MLGKGRDVNVTCLLQQRQLGFGKRNVSRKDLKLLKQIILRGRTEYRKVWQKSSKSHVACEGSRVYFDNYKTCFAGTSVAGVPRQLYQLPNVPTSRKIEDAIICSAQPEVLPLPENGHKRSIITITAHRWLRRHDLSTGAILQEVYLSTNKNFREIGWVSTQERFYVRSTHSPTLAVHRQAGIPVCIVMVLVVFDIFPLQFVGMMEIDKRIFGGDVTDAMLSQGLLIIMHQSGHVRLYSFDYILEQFRSYTVGLNEPIPDADGAVCGTFPTGLPYNIKVKECPPVLMEVRCAEHNVQIGGFPWHYLITPYGCHGWFEIYSVEDNKLAKNGELETDSPGIEPDRAVFHADDSGRILHISEDQIRLLQLRSLESSGSGSIIEDVFTIHLHPSEPKVEKTARICTSSGRSVKQRVSIDEVSECSPLTIHDVDYEDDLDLLVVSTVSQNPEGPVGHVHFFDNQTGILLREIKLEEPVKEFYEHRVFVDIDTIIQRIKVSPGRFICNIYKLFGEADGEEAIGKRRRQKKSYSVNSGSRRSTRRRRTH